MPSAALATNGKDSDHGKCKDYQRSHYDGDHKNDCKPEQPAPTPKPCPPVTPEPCTTCPAGPQGPVGPQGPAGPAGTGTSGPAGPAGAPGTPGVTTVVVVEKTVIVEKKARTCTSRRIFNITLPKNYGKVVRVTVGGKTKNQTVKNGKVRVDFRGRHTGTYAVVIRKAGRKSVKRIYTLCLGGNVSDYNVG